MCCILCGVFATDFCLGRPRIRAKTPLLPLEVDGEPSPSTARSHSPKTKPALTTNNTNDLDLQTHYLSPHHMPLHLTSPVSSPNPTLFSTAITPPLFFPPLAIPEPVFYIAQTCRQTGLSRSAKTPPDLQFLGLDKIKPIQTKGWSVRI